MPDPKRKKKARVTPAAARSWPIARPDSRIGSRRSTTPRATAFPTRTISTVSSPRRPGSAGNSPAPTARSSRRSRLPAAKGQLTANYALTGYVQLFVRFGLSPDLLDLMQNGQKYLSSLTSDVQDVNLFNNNPNRQVRAYLRFNAPASAARLTTPAATDRDSDASLRHRQSCATRRRLSKSRCRAARA